MSDSTKTTSTSKLIIAMATLATFSGVLIVLVYQLTFDKIQLNKRVALEKAVFSVLPGSKKFTEFIILGNKLEKINKDTKNKKKKEGMKIFAAYDEQSKLNGIAIEAAGAGFQDVIIVLYAFNPTEMKITGFKVLESLETPGLGDKITSDVGFLNNFSNLKLDFDVDNAKLTHDIIAVKKGKKKNNWEIEAITGATISSKAVARLITRNLKMTIAVIMKNLDTIKSNSNG